MHISPLSVLVNLQNFIMSLTPPKRLFHVPTMSTVFYGDVADDVKNKGYVAISHVWGEQKAYTPMELQIAGGVNWIIPLCNRDKITRLKSSMKCFEQEYCWFDVLCMPQDKQSEINLEIPYMGDYYKGACLTLVLSYRKYDMTLDLLIWYILAYGMKSGIKLSIHEELYIRSYRNELDETCEDSWFTRVWTFQETILSRNIILVGINNGYINLSCMCEITHWLLGYDMNSLAGIYKSCDLLFKLGGLLETYKSGNLRLVDVLKQSSLRKCQRIHDKFYGVFGVLGYKDIIVDYNTNLNDLNKLIVKYAHSKDDTSWIGISGDKGTGFVQPMYKPFTLSSEWKITKFHDYISLTDEILSMFMVELGTITHCERYDVLDPEDFEPSMRSIISVGKRLGFNNREILDSMSGYDVQKSNEMIKYFDDFVDGISFEATQNALDLLLQNKSKNIHEFNRHKLYISSIFNLMATYSTDDKSKYVAKMKGPNKNHMMIITGNPNIGDKIMTSGIIDDFGRNLGIVISDNKNRKGTCITRISRISKNARDFRTSTLKFIL